MNAHQQLALSMALASLAACQNPSEPTPALPRPIAANTDVRVAADAATPSAFRDSVVWNARHVEIRTTRADAPTALQAPLRPRPAVHK